MKASVVRVVEALNALGVEAEIIEFSQSTRTAEEAAAAVGAQVGQIVKSLVFLAGDQPVLALVSGANQASTAKLAQVCGAPIRRADADTVRSATGFSIGGVPPVGHAQSLPTYLDRDLLRFATIWAAAGTPNAVFSIAPHDLARIANAEVIDLAVEQSA
ncbi:MAG: YbaK family protein [Ktedonobacterales bacterium]|jgi:Cys-tRNA(Pro) deacylase|nr:MAG: YbaK family protein [Ktedonobacterales bacterium]